MKRHIAALAGAAFFSLSAVAGPILSGCPVFPAYNYWNTRVDNLPLHPSSATWVASVGNAAHMHADFGNVLSDYYGIPYTVVNGSQPLVPITVDPVDGSPDESDPGPYPIPPDAAVEGGPAGDGDRHVLVLENTNCRLYELYVGYPVSGGSSWSAWSAAKYDLNSNALRPAGWTSADAAGLAILPGLVRWDEVASGEVKHAIRFTANNIWGLNPDNSHKWLWPARHWSGSINNSSYPPMGARFRLKASFDITPYSAQTQVILRAMKKYGIVLADGGSNWYFQGVSDTNWSDQLFSDFSQIAGSNFEVVDTSYLQINVDSGQAVQFATMGTNFNLDPRSDLLYRNFSTGQVFRMLMNGFSVTSAALAYTEPNLAWHVIADADFNGDAVTDLLWRNDSTGQIYMQFFGSNGLPASGAFAWTEGNPAWKIVATPDFDGDGKADLLWWNSVTGQVYGMLMNGASVVAQANFHTEPNLHWKIVAVGDFAGSGKRNQLLWRNDATGQVYLMTVTVSGTTFGATGQFIYTEPNLSWKTIAAADFNGDGKTDILWRNDATGQVYMMLMNGPAILGAAIVYGDANLNWKIVAVGDYNGDGRNDILYRNFSSGQVYLLQMNGLAVSGAGFVYTEPNLNWHLLGPYEYAQ